MQQAFGITKANVSSFQWSNGRGHPSEALGTGMQAFEHESRNDTVNNLDEGLGAAQENANLTL